MLEQDGQIGQRIVQILKFTAIGTFGPAQFDQPVLHDSPGSIDLQDGPALIALSHCGEIKLVPSGSIEP